MSRGSWLVSCWHSSISRGGGESSSEDKAPKGRGWKCQDRVPRPTIRTSRGTSISPTTSPAFSLSSKSSPSMDSLPSSSSLSSGSSQVRHYNVPPSLPLSNQISLLLCFLHSYGRRSRAQLVTDDFPSESVLFRFDPVSLHRMPVSIRRYKLR